MTLTLLKVIHITSEYVGLLGLAIYKIWRMQLKYFQNYEHKGLYLGIVHFLSDLDLWPLPQHSISSGWRGNKQKLKGHIVSYTMVPRNPAK